MSAKKTVLLVVMALGLIAAVALWIASGSSDSAARRSNTEQPLTEVVPAESPPPRARSDDAAPPDGTSVPHVSGATILRVRILLPEGLQPSAVSAWFRMKPDDTSLSIPATLKGDVVSVQAPVGRGELSIHVEGCAVERWMVDAPDGSTSDLGPFMLQGAISLHGRVIDESGSPVTNAFVYPKVGDRSVPLEGTDESGRFSFDGLPEGRATLRVECDTMVRRIVVHQHGASSDPIEIVLKRGVRLSGRVLDALGKPVDAVYATVTDTNAPDDRSRMAFPSVDEDGRFKVRVAPGRYAVRVLVDGRSATEAVDVTENRPASVTLRLRR